MSRAALARIKSLTFYQDALTASRRSDPIPQLSCVGKACDLYQPDVVRCISLGGEGTNIEWKCEADLPEALRFGRVEVSCEGWDGPGDPYVLKGSCGLTYRLVQVPNALRGGNELHNLPSRLYRWFGTRDISSIIFMIIWIALVLFILYSFLKSCFEGRGSRTSARPRRPGPSPGSGWFPGTFRNSGSDGTDPPPPYTKYPAASAGAEPQEPRWRPGFWTGAALGGLGTYLLNNRRRDTPTRLDSDTRYDWERPRQGAFLRPSPFSSTYSTQRRAAFGSDDRGEGPSSLGSMRRSTGIGGSSVR